MGSPDEDEEEQDKGKGKVEMKLVMEKLQEVANEQAKMREKVERKEAEDRLRELRMQAKNFEMQASPPKESGTGSDLLNLKSEFLQFRKQVEDDTKKRTRSSPPGSPQKEVDGSQIFFARSFLQYCKDTAKYVFKAYVFAMITAKPFGSTLKFTILQGFVINLQG